MKGFPPAFTHGLKPWLSVKTSRWSREAANPRGYSKQIAVTTGLLVNCSCVLCLWYRIRRISDTKLDQVMAKEEASKTAESVGTALGLAVEELKKGYERLRNRL